MAATPRSSIRHRSDIVPNNLSRPVGRPNPPLTYQFTGFVNGDTAASADITGSADLTTTATINSPVGNYPITVTDAGTLAARELRFSVRRFWVRDAQGNTRRDRRRHQFDVARLDLRTAGELHVHRQRRRHHAPGNRAVSRQRNRLRLAGSALERQCEQHDHDRARCGQLHDPG